MKNRKGSGWVLFLFLVVGLLVAPHETALSQPLYKIGYVNSHSGFMAFIATGWRDGFLLGVDEINAAGGINGRKLDVVVYDFHSEDARATPCRVVCTHTYPRFS